MSDGFDCFICHGTLHRLELGHLASKMLRTLAVETSVAVVVMVGTHRLVVHVRSHVSANLQMSVR